MQLKLQIFFEAGNKLIPKEIPSRLLFTGPNIILSNKNVAILLYSNKTQKLNNCSRKLTKVILQYYFQAATS
jgi:hypothetical protein